MTWNVFKLEWYFLIDMVYQDHEENTIEDCNHPPLGFHVLCHSSPWLLVPYKEMKLSVKISYMKRTTNEAQWYILAGITIIALDSLGVFVELAIFIGTYRVEAQVVERGIYSRVTTAENIQNKDGTRNVTEGVTIHGELIFSSAQIEKKRKKEETYSDGGRQQPASMGLSLADLYCLRFCNKSSRSNT